MSGVYEEIQRQRGERDASFPGLYAGIAAETATLVTQKITVLLDGWDSALRIGPCRWQPRVDTYVINVAQGAEAAKNFTVAKVVLPTRGDRVLVGFDDQEDPWILVWWPGT